MCTTDSCKADDMALHCEADADDIDDQEDEKDSNCECAELCNMWIMPWTVCNDLLCGSWLRSAAIVWPNLQTSPQHKWNCIGSYASALCSSA